VRRFQKPEPDPAGTETTDGKTPVVRKKRH